MAFNADKQTLDDLNLAGRYKPDSIFNLFNRVRTTGGGKWLEYLFHHPLSDPEEINRRCAILQFFQRKAPAFPFHREAFDAMENYLGGAADGNLLHTAITIFRKQVLGSVVRDERYAMIQNGIRTTLSVLSTFHAFIGSLEDGNPDNPFTDQIRLVTEILQDRRLSGLAGEKTGARLPFWTLTRFDYLFRQVLRKELETLIRVMHELDVYIAVSAVAAEKGFSYAHALPADRNVFMAEELRHPAVKKAVGNSLSFHGDSNVLFLTGANMAGKSTLMKTFGISVYLAHMGFPVAAKAMEFSVKDGIYSSINVADALHLGYSHFYAEVLRVKMAAEAVSGGKEMVILFDELFKGTNVKDAYDATLAVTEAFSAFRNCFFIISTHIIEAGEALGKRCDTIRFSYLPTVMDGLIPRYAYTLESGITSDRQGMIIIENEGIPEILRGKNTK